MKIRRTGIGGNKMGLFCCLLFICLLLIISQNQGQEQQQQQKEDTRRISSNDFGADWSIFNVTNLNGPPNPVPVGGVLVQWGQEGLDYIANLTKHAFTRLMREYQFPDTTAEEGSFKATNIKIKEFAEPLVFVKFLYRTGIGAKILLPKVEVSGDYLMDSGWMSSEGKVRSSVRNLVVHVLLSIGTGENGHPAFDIPYCDAKMGSFQIAFSDTESFAGSMLNSFRGTIEATVTTQMSEVLCNAVRNGTEVFELLVIDPWSGPWLFDPDVLCPNVTIDVTATGPPEIEIPKTGSAVADRLLSRVKGFSVDMRLNDNTAFDSDRVILALKGDFYFEKAAAPSKPKRIEFPKSPQMLKFALTEHVPDTFLFHVYERNLAYVEEKLEMGQLPARIRAPVRLLCWNCHLKILSAPTEPPKMRMTRNGVQIVGKGWVKVTAHGFFHKFNVITGTAEIVADMKFNIVNNVIYGNLTMQRPRVQVSSSGMAGMVAATLGDSLEELIQKKVWPKLHAPVHEAIGVKGIPMPDVCGLSFKNTAISFFDGFVSVGTDLVYDMDGFMTRLLRSLERQRLAAAAATTVSSGGW